ncbi:MAG: HlyD family type I secretion periplasmic adaptor subunit [Pseudomonadota bacterium]
MKNDENARDRIAEKSTTSRVLKGGYGVIALFFGGFGLWAATAPLNGAAIASGAVAVSNANLTISHFEGGVVGEIHVRDGERVSAGDPLVSLERSRPLAEVSRLQKRHLALTAQLIRLRAERDAEEKLEFEADMVSEAKRIDFEDALSEQIAQFDVRRDRFAAESEILTQQIAGLNEAITGLEAQQVAIASQIDVLSEEADRRQGLLEQGLTLRAEYTNVIRSRAALVGEAGQLASEVARSRIQILEAEENRVRLRTQIVEEVVQQINEIRGQLEDIEEQMSAARSVLDRTIIRAPNDAYVVNLSVNTVGAALRSGDAIAELLPVDVELGVTARVSVADVDLVTPGQNANLRFAALNQRLTPEVPGTVTYVSPDRLIDQQSGQPYYEVRLSIDELPAQVSKEQVYPGMPVDALITTDERTFLEYLSRPITDSLALAFREQ